MNMMLLLAKYGFFFILLFHSQFCFGSTDGLLPDDEVYALRAVISKLGLVPAPYITTSYCSSSGRRGYSIYIICNCTYDSNTTCHIQEITTASVDLSGGVIHEGISNLTFLKKLDLGNNQLSGPIPDTIGKLQYLETLNLFRNLLTDHIPPSLGDLKFLKHMRLYRNMLSGHIPSEFHKLSNLETLRLEQNNLNGNIPPELQSLWRTLKQLRLDENQLTGTLPHELGNLINLLQFDVSSNNLTGELPDNFKKLAKLNIFAVAGNNLKGSVPNYIANWKRLTSLYLMGNEFEYLPPEIFNMENLEYLMVSDLNNKSSFSFPKHANLKNIYHLILRNCSINGSIPEYISEWSSLKDLDLSFNSLTGKIPDSLEKLSLIKLFLTRNMLNGTLPPWILNKGIDKLDLSYNNFTELPQAANIKPNGKNYMLDMNEKYLANNSKYNSLYINCGGLQENVDGNSYDADNSTSNYFEAPNGKWVYTCSGDFWSTTSNTSDYIKNMTCGISEKSLYRTGRLCPHSMSYYAFGLHEGEYNVTLHFAETVYTSEADYSEQGKRVFDVYVQGEIKLKDFNIKQRAGPNEELPVKLQTKVKKDNLLHINLYWAGKGSLYNPPALNGPLLSAISVFPSHKKKLSPAQIAGIILGSVFTPLILLAFAWQMGWLRNKELDEKIKLEGKEVTVRLIIEATQNFSPKARINKGSSSRRFGELYKAELKDPPIILVVEKLSTELEPKVETEIQNEVAKLTMYRHENLLRLHDCYSKKSINLLIYEYMENGSLHDALLVAREPLDWEVRLHICLGIAKGLRYLHEECKDKIVHGNVTDQNIMLGKSYTAKLSEFGLAEIYDDKPFLKPDEQRRPCFANMAPECVYNPMTIQADVYSFGNIMLEIVSRQPTVTYEKDQIRILRDRADDLQKKGTILDLVDKESVKTSDDEEQAMEIIKLAMKCLNTAPTSRPKMSEIVDKLKDIIQMNEKKSSPGSSSLVELT